MKPTMTNLIIEDVSEILDTFNLEEITRLLYSQIDPTEDQRSTHMVDHFKPLYYKYKSIISTEENTEDMKTTATERFQEICNIFLDLICKKFHIEINTTWREDHITELPGLIMALYSFFVLDIISNLEEVCINFIRRNAKMICEVFEDKKNNKDAATISNKRSSMTVETVLIASNIYDVTSWILSQLSEQQYIIYMDQEYIPLRLISSLLEEGLLAGQFMMEINDLYSTNIDIKSAVCFNILAILKKEGV